MTFRITSVWLLNMNIDETTKTYHRLLQRVLYYSYLIAPLRLLRDNDELDRNYEHDHFD